MRVLAWFLLPALCAAGQELTVQGTVTHAITHEPLAGVQVRLVLIKGLDRNNMEAYGAQTDRAGHFEVGGVKAGRYLLMPTLRGFVHIPAKGEAGLGVPSIPIKAGQNQDLKIEMAPHAMITGRVLDGDGEPVQNAFVQLESTAGAVGAAGGASTDDRGMFRVTAAPGPFHVRVTYFQRGQAEKRTDGSVPMAPVPTYYPSVTAKDAAVVVEARAGEETGGIDIRLGGVGAGSRSFSIRGVISGLPDGRDGRQPMVIIRDKEGRGGITRSVSVASSGAFTLDGLLPGEYELQGSLGDSLCPPKTVTITNADVANVELRLLSPITVTGRLVVKGDPPGPLKDKWRVGLRPTDTMFAYQSPRSAEVGPDGVFQLSVVPDFGVRASLPAAPEGVCIRSLELDGANLRANAVLTFPSSGASLLVTVSRKCAVISGTVKGRDGAPLQDAVGFALLVSDPGRLDLADLNAAQAVIQADGKFEFKGVAPGRYRVLALDSTQAAVRSPADLPKVAALQKEFEVQEGDHLRIEVKVVTREDLDGKK